MLSRFCICLGCLALLLVFPGCGGGSSSDTKTPSPARRTFPLETLQQVNIVINQRTLRVWVMDTPEKRAEGMMHLGDENVAADEGMLFVFPTAEPRSFWMRDTFIPLEIAYIGSDGKIVSTASLLPLDESPVNSGSPAKFALEVKQGTFGRLGIVPGMTVLLPAGIAAQR